MAGVQADLELNIRPALTAIGKVDTALDRVAKSFSVNLAKALSQLTAEVDIKADTHTIAPALDRAIANADTSIDFDAETSGITATIDRAVSNADTSVEVEATTTGVTGAIDRAVSNADTSVEIEGTTTGITAAIDRAVDNADTSVELTADTSQMEAGTSRATKGVGGLNTALLGVAATGVAATALVGAGLFKMGQFGLEAAANMEQTQVAFEGILGSTSAANKFLEELRVFAARTPFEFPDLATAAKQLLAVGFAAEDVLPVMTDIGNVAATLGVGAEGINSVVRALGQMKGKGKASAEELMQISEAIPGFSAVGAVAQHLGVTTAEAFDMIADGAVPADVAIDGIIAGMKEFPGAAGAMERQAATLLGVFSTFKDTVRDALVTGIQPALGGITTAINDAMPSIASALGGLGASFGGVISALVPVLGSLITAISPIATLILGIVQTLGTALQPVLAAIASAIVAAQPAFDAFGRGIAALAGPLSDALVALVPAITPLLSIIGKVAEVAGGVLGQALVLVTPLIARLATALFPALERVISTLAPVLGIAGDLFIALAPTIDVLATTFEQFIAELEPVLTLLGESFIQVLTALAPVLPDLAAAFLELTIATMPLIPPLARLALEVIPPLTDLLVLLLPPLTKLLTLSFKVQAKAIEDTSRALGMILDVMSGGIQLLKDFVRNFDFGEVLQKARDALERLKTVVSEALDNVVEFFRGLGGRVVTAIGDIGTAIWNAITGGFDFLKSQVQLGVDGIVTVFTNLPGQILTAVGDLGGTIWGAITGGMSTLVSNVTGIVGDLVGAFIGIAGKITGAIGDLGGDIWNKISGGLSTTLSNVRGFAGDVVSAITGIPGQIGGALAGLGDTIFGLIKTAINKGIDRANDLLPNSIDLPWPLGSVNLPDNPLPHLHTGGVVPGPTGQEVSTMLLGGERVLSLDQTRAFDALVKLVTGQRLTMPATVAATSSTNVIQFNVNVSGVEDASTARKVGKEIGDSALKALTRRRVSVAARTGGVG